MAKFTVYFKDKPIHSGIYDAGVLHIGRDDSNELVVDSLAVAPAHAVVIIKNDGCLIKQLNEKFPLLINNKPSKEWSLQNNDVINVGKHSIVFSTTEMILESAETVSSSNHHADDNDFKANLESISRLQEASLQVMDGPNIGRVLLLKKAMTRLGHDGQGVVVIARRKDGYYVSALQTHNCLSVNKRALGDNTVLLQHNDIIEVANTPMQFLLEKSHA